MPGPLSPDSLNDMIQKKDDTTFVLVDVRPPAEYRLEHIPGAVNIPLKTVESDAMFRTVSCDVVFYCRNGMRSKVAAILAIDAGLAEEKAFSLDGGMAAYAGEILLELPKLVVFEDDPDPASVLATAVNLEKGAWRFYEKAAAMAVNKDAGRFLKQMAGFETDHARMLFDRLDSRSKGSLSFHDYFHACSGHILEGGKSFDEVLTLLSGNAKQSDILDLALDIEVAAYDLYKRTCVHCRSGKAREFFLGLARAEKQHMAGIVNFLDAWED